MDKDFETILRFIDAHLKREKVFIQNSDRIKDVACAMKIAELIFPDLKVELEDDPLQTGALILSIKCTDVDPSMIVYGDDILLFNEMVSKANNFELCVINGKLQFNAVFQGALTLIS